MADARWSDLVWSHGMAAYERDDDAEYAVDASAVAQFERLLRHPEWELAVSRAGEELGLYGVYLEGEILEVFSRDAGSEVVDGIRYPSEWAWNHCISDAYDEYATAEADGDGLESYYEAFLTNARVVAFWVSEWAWDNRDNELTELARTAYAHNIPVVCKGGHRTELSIEDLYSIGRCAVALE